jgi:toxin ParE1/3/4
MNYVAQDSPARAIKLVNRLVAAPRNLAQFPLMGRVVPEFGLEHLRELVTVRPYRILYVVREDHCSIVAVIRGSRDLSALLKPEDFDVD